jgi:hypothetical protein
MPEASQTGTKSSRCSDEGLLEGSGLPDTGQVSRAIEWTEVADDLADA